MVTPLHNHSEYSGIDGVSTCEEIALRCIDIGAEAAGLTDHGVVAGHLEFDKVMRKYDLNPIFGCELYHGLVFTGKKPKRDQAHLIALAMTDEGLQNLWRMNDAAAQEDHFHHVGRVDIDILRQYKEGVVFTSACPGGLVPQGIMNDDYSWLNEYLGAFGDNFYIELPTYPGNSIMRDFDFEEPFLISDLVKQLVTVARERGIPMVPGDDGHYAFPHQYEYHNAYIAAKTKQDIYMDPDDRKMWHPAGALCIKSEEEIRAALSYLPEDVVNEAIGNSNELGRRANAHLPEVTRHLPKFIPNESPWVQEGSYEDDQADLLFLDLVEAGIYNRYGDNPSNEVWERVGRESEVLIDAGLEHYFLLGWDVIQFADYEDIERGPGRGSSAGCIVAYALGITDIDPLPYDLIFERFWNPGRAKGFPDIDTDFARSGRRKVKDYVTDRWGHNRVRSIGTVARMKPKSVIDHLWGAYAITFTEKEELKKIIEDTPDIEILGVDQIGWDPEIEPGKTSYVMTSVGHRIEKWIQEGSEYRRSVEDQQRLRRFVDACAVLCNRVANYGVHASGIVISDTDLPPIAPCRFAGSPDQRIPVTQFAMDDIDALMLVKFDALGLRTLDVLQDWRRQMRERHGIEIDWSGLEWQPHDDAMWELMDRGFAAGIFQIEKGYPKKLAEEFHPRSVSDISIINALNRPGPIRSHAPESFIARRRGDEEVVYDSPFVEDILEPTYGWFLYQEQVIRFFNKLGYSDSDADAVRKILGKKQPEKWLALFRGEDEWKNKGYMEMAGKAELGDLRATDAKNWNGQDVETPSGKNIFPAVLSPAWIIWCKIVNFAKYSFNKSHTVAYATIGFRALYAKYTGTPEFYMSCIRHVDQQKKDLMIPPYVNEARRWGIKVLPPDIEWSLAEVAVHGDDVIFGFSDVKNVGAESAEFLVRLRDIKKIAIATPEALYDDLERINKEFLKRRRAAKKAGEMIEEGKSPKQWLQENKIASLYTAGAWRRLLDEHQDLATIQACEKEMLSVILTDNVAEAYVRNEEAIADCDTYDDALAPWDAETGDSRWRLPGVVVDVRETRTRKDNKAMGIVTIEHNGDTLEFAVFSDRWKHYKSFLFKERTPVIVTIDHRLDKAGIERWSFREGHKLT